MFIVAFLSVALAAALAAAVWSRVLKHMRVRMVARRAMRDLRDCATVLDLGSGRGEHTDWLQNEGELFVTPLDVKSRRDAIVAPMVFDGSTIPFADNAFDATLCSFILHHATAAQVESLLYEILRVTRLRAIIFEDTPETQKEWSRAKAHAPHGVRSCKEWILLFESAGFVVERAERISKWEYPFSERTLPYLVTKTCFVLRREALPKDSPRVVARLRGVA